MVSRRLRVRIGVAVLCVGLAFSVVYPAVTATRHEGHSPSTVEFTAPGVDEYRLTASYEAASKQGHRHSTVVGSKTADGEQYLRYTGIDTPPGDYYSAAFYWESAGSVVYRRISYSDAQAANRLRDRIANHSESYPNVTILCTTRTEDRFVTVFRSPIPPNESSFHPSVNYPTLLTS